VFSLLWYIFDLLEGMNFLQSRNQYFKCKKNLWSVAWLTAKTLCIWSLVINKQIWPCFKI